MKSQNGQMTYILLIGIISSLLHEITSITIISTPNIVPQSNSISNSSTGDQYQTDISIVPNGNHLTLTFEITTPSVLTYTFVMLSFEPNIYEPGEISRFTFYGKSYLDYEGIMDLTGMQLGRKQFINMEKQSGKDTLYMTVYNVDLASRKATQASISFQMKLSYQSGLSCSSCNGGTRVNSSSCVCENCPAGFYGEDCSINMLVLGSGLTTTTQISGPGQKFFQIEGGSEVTVIVKLSSGEGEAYFQFIQFTGEFATFTNVAVGRRIQGRFSVVAGTSGTSISATSSGTPMSLTVAVYDDITTNVEVYYEAEEESSILLIILAVVGSVLFVGLLIAACYIMRTAGQNSQQGSSQPPRQARLVEQRLSEEEVERFFPTFIMGEVQKAHDGTTMENIMNQEEMKKQNDEPEGEDCVICLCPVESTDEAKITYCRHIFHANCLRGWFKKQQNCPYCRMEFNRANTIKLYKGLKDQNNPSVPPGHSIRPKIMNMDPSPMQGQSLVQAILDSKVSVGSKNSITQKDTQQIQVASRNTVEIEDMNS